MEDIGETIYKCREVILTYKKAGGKYFVHIAGEGTRAVFTNPITAWACFIDVLDGRVRRRIGDMLEQDGKNRYTGEPKEVKPDAG